MPSASIPLVTCQIYCLPPLLTILTVCPGLIGVGSSNNFQDFLLPSHVQVLHSIGHVRQDPNKMFNRTLHCIQVICPAQMMEHQSVGAIHVFIKKRATSFLSDSAIVSCNIFIGCDVFVRGESDVFNSGVCSNLLPF